MNWPEARAKDRGDFIDAMHRVTERSEIAYATLWNLRYRTPPSISVESYLAILLAYAENRPNAEAKTQFGAALLRGADEIRTAP